MRDRGARPGERAAAGKRASGRRVERGAERDVEHGADRGVECCGNRRLVWAGAGTMVAVVASLIAAPLLLEALVPNAPEDRIGVYERVEFQEAGADGPVLAGLIAPAGWSWAGGRQAGTYAAPDDAAIVSVSLRTDVADPEALLRESLPVGASALQIETSLTGSGLGLHSGEHDLAAGDNPSLGVALCTRSEPTHCVLVDAVFTDAVLGGGGDRRERTLAELHRMFDSVELLP